MARIFITGSSDGLGRAAAQTLLDEGHDVVLHARSSQRAASALADLAPRAAGVVIGDLASAAETRRMAEQVNALGRMDAVIHNAGVYLSPTRGSTPEGHATVLAVNTLAPYLLTALIDRPDRLVYLSSGLHRAGTGPLHDLDWTTRPWNPDRAYAESKLYLVALACALARRWPDVAAHAVDPGWVRTRMGGAHAPVDIPTGQQTQTWLVTHPDASAIGSGGYWCRLSRQTPAREALDEAYQEQLLAELARLTGVALP